MKLKSSSRRKRHSTKSILRLPDVEHAKAAALNSLDSADAKRGYRHAIDEFVDWYCSEPRLAFNRIVVLRYRSHLESRHLAPEPSICGLAPCAGSPTKPPPAVFSTRPHDTKCLTYLYKYSGPHERGSRVMRLPGDSP
jgi:hypothetical protein